MENPPEGTKSFALICADMRLIYALNAKIALEKEFYNYRQLLELINGKILGQASMYKRNFYQEIILIQTSLIACRT